MRRLEECEWKPAEPGDGSRDEQCNEPSAGHDRRDNAHGFPLTAEGLLMEAWEADTRRGCTDIARVGRRIKSSIGGTQVAVAVASIQSAHTADTEFVMLYVPPCGLGQYDGSGSR